MEKVVISEERYGPKAKYFIDDDFTDRLNNRITIVGLLTCIIIITGQTYVGKPINCWTPAEFKDTQNSYANSICWLKGSYYLPTQEIAIPDRLKPRLYYMSYYQWTPFILLGMALLFLFPKIIWRTFTRQGGLNIHRLIQAIKEKKEDDKGLDLAKRTLKYYFERQNKLHGSLCCGIRCNNFYLGYTMAYFIVKILYVINTLAQFFLLNAFLSFHSPGYGVEALNKLISGDGWFESSRFPRVTMCDFMIRHLGSNQHWYAIQCNLPINMFNEAIFLGVWIWLIVLTILNVLSIISWIVSLTPAHRLATIEKCLKVVGEIPAGKDRSSLLTSSSYRPLDRTKRFHDFIVYLRTDGFLICRIIALNTDEVISGQIIQHLYEHFLSSTWNRTSDV